MKVTKRWHWIGVVLLLAAPMYAQPPGAFLGELTWPEAEHRIRTAPLVIIPFGAGAKEHGPHLPMNADAVVMDYLCRKAVEQLPVLVAPPILHGWFPAFRDYPGTEVADPHVFQKYVFEVARSLVRQGAQRLVFLNTGITLATGLPLSIVAREIRVQFGVPTLVVSWDDLETEAMEALQEQPVGGHADEIETSIHLYLQPERVKMEQASRDVAGGRKNYPGYKPGLFSRNPNDPAYSETGLFGDPTLATAEKGKKTLAILTKQWLKALRGFASAKLRKTK
ncbi:MAG: creatininase family protein [candidate division KSB1 bacterium]|nr:creatininase family protein [candidate division KSB1 bacterium]MDQ7062764.1 creatininase family protein [candidate division KSB1 bacterium]